MKRAVILAAGIGSRLRPITEYKPKTLVQVNGKPILAHTIDALLEGGITSIVIVTGYLSESVRKFCQDAYPDTHFTFIENDKFDTTNNLYSLYLARHYLTEDSIVMNGDLVFDSAVIKRLKTAQGTRVAVDAGRFIDESMKVVVRDGIIRHISKKVPHQDAYGCSIDIYKFTKSDLKPLVAELEKTVGRGILTEWTEAALDRLFSDTRIKAAPLPIGRARWMEIDNLEDLHAAERLFNKSAGALKRRKIFFIDNDGTLAIQNGDSMKALPGAREFIATLIRQKKTFYISTKNSSLTPAEIVARLKKQGISVKEKHILISTHAAVEYLKAKGIKRVFWVANAKTGTCLKKMGFRFDKKNPQALLLCYDTEITYAKLRTMVEFVRAGVPYYATHIDTVCPTEHGPIPDIGLFIEMIRRTTGKSPLQTFGKPDANFILPILRSHKLSPKDAVVMGDRLYTDIAMANNAGALGVLVLSGETTRPDYETSTAKADIVVRDVAELATLL